ncbi:MAG: DUF192 domain-containing protein [Flavobacteriaceae bacterium]
MRKTFSWLAVGAVALLLTLAAMPAFARADAPDTALQPLIIETGRGRTEFMVEMADTPALRSKGLMFRPSLAPDRGMLFDFLTDQEITMWMENTPVSLDMIFLAADGSVTRIARNTEPFSRDIIGSRGPARAVLEVAAGTARRIGLKPGDIVRHRMFGNLE